MKGETLEETLQFKEIELTQKDGKEAVNLQAFSFRQIR